MNNLLSFIGLLLLCVIVAVLLIFFISRAKKKLFFRPDDPRPMTISEARINELLVIENDGWPIDCVVDALVKNQHAFNYDIAHLLIE